MIFSQGSGKSTSYYQNGGKGKSKGFDNKGKRKADGAAPDASKNKKANMKCFACGKWGHLAAECKEAAQNSS